MSLEGLVKEIEDARKMEQARWMAAIREQHEAAIRAKDEEISVLKDEIETLRRWLDHSALPAANPISRRPDALGLIKINFGDDRPCPDVWSPGEKEVLDSIGRERLGESTDKESALPEFPDIPEPKSPEVPETGLPEPPKPDRIHLPGTGPSEPGEITLPGQEQTGLLNPEPHGTQEAGIPGPESHKIETLRPVRAARRIAGLRGSLKRKAKRPRSRQTKGAG